MNHDENDEHEPTSWLNEPLLRNGIDNEVTEPLFHDALPSKTDLCETTTEEDENKLSLSGLLLLRLVYLLNGLAAACWGRFSVVYYNRVKHFSPEKIGILQGVTPLLSFVAEPCLGWVADVVKSRKYIYILCKVLGTVALLIVPWTSTFASLFVCVSGVAIFRVTGVLDAQALDFLGTKHRGLYGTIRMWTAISWGIGAVLMGWAIDRLAFKYNFIFYGICMGVMVLVIEFGFPNRSKSEQALIDQGTQSESNRRRLPQFKELRKAMCRFPVVFWLLEVAIIGAAVSISDSFLFVFMQNELRASTKLCGFTAGITVLFEIPVFLFSQPLLKRVGHDGLFLVATAVYTIRVVGYTFLTLSTVTWILLLEVLHGLTFACMWIASVDFSAAIAPEEWSTTVQSILSAVFTCIGAGLGPIVGGRVMQRFGASYLYRGAGLMVGSTMVIHLLILVFFRQGLSQHIVKLQQEKRDDEGRNREEPIL